MKFIISFLIIVVYFGCTGINMPKNLFLLEIYPNGSLEEFYKCELDQEMLLVVTFGKAKLNNNAFVLDKVVEKKKIILNKSVFENINHLIEIISKKPSHRLERIRKGGWRICLYYRGEQKVYYDFHKIGELGTEYEQLIRLIIFNSPLKINIHPFS